MGDSGLRDLERSVVRGEPGAAERLVGARIRAGTLDEEALLLLGYVDCATAVEALGDEAPDGSGPLPSWLAGLSAWGRATLVGALVAAARTGGAGPWESCLSAVELWLAAPRSPERRSECRAAAAEVGRWLEEPGRNDPQPARLALVALVAAKLLDEPNGAGLERLAGMLPALLAGLEETAPREAVREALVPRVALGRVGEGWPGRLRAGEEAAGEAVRQLGLELREVVGRDEHRLDLLTRDAEGRARLLRVFRQPLDMWSEAWRRWSRRGWTSLRHPNLTPLLALDAFPELELSCLLTPWPAGVTLEAWLARRGRLAPAEAARLLDPLAAVAELLGLDASTAAAAALRPAGIRMRRGGVPVVADAIALDWHELTIQPDLRRQERWNVDSMSPESLGSGVPGPRGLVFTLGALLYALLVGAPPYPEERLVSRIQRIRAGEILPPAEQGVTLPAPVEAVLLQSLARDPEQRFAGPRQLARALRVAVGG